MASLNIVLVTGANTGIGYETVKALLQADKPYHVLLGSRSLDKGHQAIEALREECPGTANTVEAVQLDLTSDDSIEKAFVQIKASPGHIDTLINNAGTHTLLNFVFTQADVHQGQPLILSSWPERYRSASASTSRTT